MEDGFLPPGLTIGPSSVDLTLSDSFSWPKPENDKIILGESVPHKQVQNAGFIDAGFNVQITLELEYQSGFSIVLK